MGILEAAETEAENTRQKLLGGPNRAEDFRRQRVAKMREETVYFRAYITSLAEKVRADKAALKLTIIAGEPTINAGQSHAYMTIKILTASPHSANLIIIHEDGNFVLSDDREKYPPIGERKQDALVKFVETWIKTCQMEAGYESPEY